MLISILRRQDRGSGSNMLRLFDSRVRLSHMHLCFLFRFGTSDSSAEVVTVKHGNHLELDVERQLQTQ